ncbi:radical SAM protein [soil metagenome]
MPDIVLTTLNAKYAHAAFGLRYLMANLGELAPRAVMLEFDIAARTTDVIEAILSQSPKIVGIGVYIWNVQPAEQLVAELKRLRPELIVVLGGPEVSYEVEQQEICRLADYVVTGEADLAFANLCGQLLGGERPLQKIIAAELPEFEEKLPIADLRLPIVSANSKHSALGHRHSAIHLPYALYTNEDLAHRVIYVEASRGCPFKCEFCLSSLDVPVRNAPLVPFLDEMQKLLDRGCRQFKFVDRTFNLNLTISKSILKFFLDRYTPGLFLHFEMIPDRLPEALRELIAQFAPGALQFEVGVQSLNDDVQHRISRKQDNGKLAENLLWLREHTGVHVHADMIVGLPGEDLASFGRGFDRLVAMRPQEIQVGILKRLRGTPIVRHDAEWGMVYSPHAPYEVLQTSVMDFNTLQRLRRFSRYWDLIANSGNFVVALPLVWSEGSPFDSFLRLSDWLFEQTGRQHGISLTHLAELLFRFLVEETKLAPSDSAAAIWADYQRIGRSDRPAFLKDLVPPADTRKIAKVSHAVSRQQRHLAK